VEVDGKEWGINDRAQKASYHPKKGCVDGNVVTSLSPGEHSFVITYRKKSITGTVVMEANGFDDWKIPDHKDFKEMGDRPIQVKHRTYSIMPKI
jgi:hypothetical protein